MDNYDYMDKNTNKIKSLCGLISRNSKINKLQFENAEKFQVVDNINVGRDTKIRTEILQKGGHKKTRTENLQKGGHKKTRKENLQKGGDKKINTEKEKKRGDKKIRTEKLQKGGDKVESNPPKILADDNIISGENCGKNKKYFKHSKKSFRAKTLRKKFWRRISR